MAVSGVVLFSPTSGQEPLLPYVDKAVHVGVFALVTAAAVWRFGRVPAVVLAAAAYALGSEVVQGGLLPGRQADAWDVVADLLGVGVVWLLPAARAGASRT